VKITLKLVAEGHEKLAQPEEKTARVWLGEVGGGILWVLFDCLVKKKNGEKSNH